MKQAICWLAAAVVMSCLAAAQSNPVMESVRQIMQRQQKNLVGAAEEMPAEKYGFRPTSQQMTFGTLVTHMVESNTFLCSRIAGTAEPKEDKLKVSATDPKDKLVSALKSSFDYCNSALSKVTDSQLGAQVKLWGGREMPKAGAAIGLTNDWADHYSQAAVYLRLNGMLPPSAKKKSE
ncbi:MAG TPA: DinB family protein [Terriglobales bacterium]|nr:DinB family protein [Terriglobales bacterium]